MYPPGGNSGAGDGAVTEGASAAVVSAVVGVAETAGSTGSVGAAPGVWAASVPALISDAATTILDAADRQLIIEPTLNG